MFAPGLHALGGNGPQSRLKVYFGPSCPARLARTRRGQNGEFNGARGNAVPLPEPNKEFWNISKRHGRQMTSGELSQFRQKLVEMAAPASGVFARSTSTGLCGVEHTLNSTAEPRGCFWLGLPKRLQAAEHVFRRNGVNGFRPERLGVNTKCLPPLVAMLGIPEPQLNCLDVLIRYFPEGRNTVRSPAHAFASS